MNSASQQQRTAIVTGGGTGLGLATALELRAQNFRVIAIGLDTEPELEGSGVDFRCIDITDETAMRAIAAAEPRVDVLVNAAGTILHEGREHTVEGFRKVIDINLNGTQLACLLFRAALAEARGNIINFASMWSFFGSPKNPGYAASKGAVVALTRSLAVAYAADGVRVNAIAPGWIETRMATTAMNDPERSQAIIKRVPAGFWGKPADIAKAARFLASDDARYITGVILPVDGGYSIA
jgi:NAD(P)-dependent dehydrogenase (short-subunit alcohol dehydrogenase family)